MRVLITGAAGFIGSHLYDRLKQDGHHVWGIDNLTTGRAENVEHYHGFHFGDICSMRSRYDDGGTLDLVIHCAASYKDPSGWWEDIRTNVQGTTEVVRLVQKHEARLVYFQTALPPISSYAISKIAAEQYINLSGLPALIFRLANVYGPRNLSGPIPTFYKRLTAGEACTVTDTSRDMVYIDDLVRLVVSGINQEKTGKYDICSGIHRPIRELYDAVARAVGDDSEPTEIPAPADDVKQMELNPTRALTELDNRAFTPFPDGINSAVAWYREHAVGDTYTHLNLKG